MTIINNICLSSYLYTAGIPNPWAFLQLGCVSGGQLDLRMQRAGAHVHVCTAPLVEVRVHARVCRPTTCTSRAACAHVCQPATHTALFPSLSTSWATKPRMLETADPTACLLNLQLIGIKL